MQMTVTVRIAAEDYNEFSRGQPVEVFAAEPDDPSAVTILVTVPATKVVIVQDDNVPYATYRPFA